MFIGGDRVTISGTIADTTHNRMELQAAIESLKLIDAQCPGGTVRLYSDSQYLVGLQGRKGKILDAVYKTRKGNDIANLDLVKELWQLQEKIAVRFTKVEAHTKKTTAVNHNTEVDMIVRRLLRGAVVDAADRRI